MAVSKAYGNTHVGENMKTEGLPRHNVKIYIREALDLYQLQCARNNKKIQPIRAAYIQRLEDVLATLSEPRQCYETCRELIEHMPQKRYWWGWGGEMRSVLKSLLQKALVVAREMDDIVILRRENLRLQKDFDDAKETLHTVSLNHTQQIAALHQDHAEKIMQLQHTHHQELSVVRQELSYVKQAVGIHMRLRSPESERILVNTELFPSPASSIG